MNLSLDVFHDIEQCLPNHKGYFCPIVKHYGIATFIKKHLSFINVDDVIIHKNDAYIDKGPTHQRKMQCLTYEHRTHPVTICNVHGLWNGKGKLDSPERIIQSEHIKTYLDTVHNPFILCGDFNLEPSTKSLGIIKNGLVDHIDINTISSTRTPYYNKEIKFADYIFTSPKVETREFKVLGDVVSDHTPLFISYTT